MISERSYADGGVFLRQDGPICQIVLRNPKRLNAVRLDMWTALGDLAAELGQSGTRAVIISGDGDRAFSVGADISEFKRVRTTPAQVQHYNRAVARALDGLAALPMPVIAAVAGHCIGGGLELALRCDLRIAAEDASFAFTPAKLGLAVGADEVAALARIASPSATAEMLFTAAPVTAARAESWGLVNKTVPTTELATEANRIAQAIASNAPLTLRAVKAGLAAHADPCNSQAAKRAAELVTACYASDDYKEGQAAFAEKRKPRFTGS